MNITDSSYELLKEEGYTGSKPDVVYKKLKDLTGKASSTPDMWYQWLRSLGYTGTVDEMLSKHFKGKGYEGSIQDLLFDSNFFRDLYYANEGMVADFALGRYIIEGRGAPHNYKALALYFDRQVYGQDNNVATFDELLDITRSSSKYVFDSSGTLTEVPANTPAYEYDPVTGAAKGISIEGSATNLLTYSDNFAAASWGKSNITVESSSLSERGFNFSKIVPSAAADNSYLFRSIDSVGKIFTLYVKKELLRYVGIANAAQTEAVLDLDTGILSKTSDPTNDYSVTDVGGGIYRVGIYNKSATNFQIQVFFGIDASGNNIATDGVSGVYVSSAQIEEGTQPTSYIPTTTSTVTRAADIVTSDPLTFGDWFNASEGTFVVEWRDDKDSYTRHILNVAIDLNNYMPVYINAGGEILFGVRTAGGALSQIKIGDTVGGGNILEIKYDVASGTIKGSANGGAEQTLTGITFFDLSLAKMTVGARDDGAFPMFGKLKSLTYKDTAA